MCFHIFMNQLNWGKYLVNQNNTGLPRGKRTLPSLPCLSFNQITDISSIGLLGLTTYPQEAWANHLPPPSTSTFVPASGSTVCDFQPDLDWADVTGANRYRIQIDNDNAFRSIDFTNDVSGEWPKQRWTKP